MATGKSVARARAEPDTGAVGAPDPMRTGAGSDSEDEQIALLCKALAHPARVQIARFLSTQDACYFGSLAGQLPQSRSTVSQHITLMKQGGLVIGSQSGDRGCYCLDRDALARLKAFVAAL